MSNLNLQHENKELRKLLEAIYNKVKPPTYVSCYIDNKLLDKMKKVLSKGNKG